jgi:hypothetical protein
LQGVFRAVRLESEDAFELLQAGLGAEEGVDIT